MLKRLFLIPRAFKSVEAPLANQFKLPKQSDYITSFSEIDFPQNFQKLLSQFSSPTEIQSKSLKLLMDNKDLIGIAPTGSGKTLAFALPALVKAAKYQQQIKKNEIFTLIVCPTRQLSVQITQAISPFAKLLRLKIANLYGGAPKREQFYSARRANVIVATPGRLMDYMNTSYRNMFTQVQSLILDEADRMLDLNFEQVMNEIVQKVPSTRQTLLFSATWDKDIEMLANEYINQENAYYVQIGNNTISINKNIAIEFHVTSTDRILDEMSQILNKRPNDKVLIFCNTKHDTRDLAFDLNETVDRRVNFMTSDLSQDERINVLKTFKQGTNGILVATDVASRGIDVKNIDLVINCGFPNNSADFIHRVGRTGRGGKSGEALTFIMKNSQGSATEKNLKFLAKLYKEQGIEIPQSLQTAVKKLGLSSLLRQPEQRSRRNNSGFSRKGDNRSSRFQNNNRATRQPTRRRNDEQRYQDEN